MFNLRETPVTTHVWSLLKYILCWYESLNSLEATESIDFILHSISLDQLVICSFYAICRVFNINITFHNILDVYTSYLLPFQAINNIVEWGDVNRLWFDIDLTFIPNVLLRSPFSLVVSSARNHGRALQRLLRSLRLYRDSILPYRDSNGRRTFAESESSS